MPDEQELAALYTRIAETLLQSPHFMEVVDAAVERVLASFLKQVETLISKPYLNNREAAHLLVINAEVLTQMRMRGEGPPWSGSGRWVRYSRIDCIEWLRKLPITNNKSKLSQ